MIHSTTTLKLLVAAAAMTFASQANAHYVFDGSTPIPAIASGASVVMTINCPPHHYSVSGGYSRDPSSNGSIVVTGSYPGTTQSWSVEFTNTSGRPTVAGEATADLYVTCGHHHHW